MWPEKLKIFQQLFKGVIILSIVRTAEKGRSDVISNGHVPTASSFIKQILVRTTNHKRTMS